MYAKDRTTIVDRREMLRVKLKSLAAEARIIRHEERRTHGVLWNSLYRHRIDVVRPTARHTHLAYGLIKGRTYEQMEPSHKPGKLDPNWDIVDHMVKKYGSKEWIVDNHGVLFKEVPAKVAEAA